MIFHFKHFSVQHQNSAMKVGTDAMVLGAMANPYQAKTVLDIGAGTGVLSLMLAQKNPEAQITAIEVDAASFEDCQMNFKNSSWSNRLEVIHDDFLSHQFDKQFDFIISNPPFYQNSLHNSDLKLATARHNDFLPMDQLLSKVAAVLNENGIFCLIFPFQDSEEIKKLAYKAGLYVRKETTINGKPETPVRTILELCLEKVEQTEFHNFTIRKSDGSYSDDYRQLTVDFHGKVI